MIGYLYFVSLLVFPVCIEASQKMDSIKSIAETVNGFLMELTPENIIEKIELHYKVLGLMDSGGE